MNFFSSLPPGMSYLVANIFSFSFLAPVVVTFVIDDLLVATGFSLRVPIWVSTPLCLASAPLSFILRRLWKKCMDTRAAAKLGARLAPVIKGKLPGNLDIMIEFVARSRDGYPGEAQMQWTEELGSNTINAWVLWEDCIFTTEPEHIKASGAMLATDFQNFIKGDRFKYSIESVLGSGVFNADGLFHRSMTRPFFSRDRISHFDIFDRHAEAAITRMKERLNAGYAIDFQDLAYRFTLDSATEFLFDNDVCSLASPFPYPHNSAPTLDPSNLRLSQAERFSRALAESQHIIAERSRMGDVWPLLEMFKDKTKEPMAVVNGYIEPILREALEKRRDRGMDGKEGNEEEVEEGETLLEHLVKFTSSTHPVVLRDQILNIMIAGRDTTAVTLTCAIYLLAMHPLVLTKLRSEILDYVGPSRRPMFDDIREMRYLRAVLNETLRLFPVVESVNATTFPSSDPTLKPIHIPAKTSIPYSVFLMHRRTDLWGPDAEEFDPERFIDTRLKKYLTPNPFIFLPFNAGPRICPGQQFAYNEMSFFLIRLFQAFSSIALSPLSHPPDTLPPPDWSSAKGRKGIERFWPKSHLTMYSLGGLRVNMEEAKDVL
ncbi:hypothetical protein JAAARDRAFT_142639 [Jaapia argillacea MUCL 33604]|uniref:Cytochrome P450 monooxygenase pc-3 n=1 Tax=Jaapia argillacea MUCL 33604 TaxID=933084 RepID=A0A067P838_9AGAM|nr:hypothetical protein JAAARDRAFT_142639 [Jaapia argillacea MUCL 33604]